MPDGKLTTLSGRLLKTEVPGPGSRELAQRRAAAIPRGVGATLPVFVTRAGPGLVEDVDGNGLIDFGSGHLGDQRRQQRSRRRRSHPGAKPSGSPTPASR